MLNSMVMAQSLEAKQKMLRKTVHECNSLQLIPISMHWSMFSPNLRHRWTSKSCPPSLPWHKVRKPPQRVVHWKLSPWMAAIMSVVSGRGSRAFRRRLWLCACTYITQRIHPTRKKTLEPLRRRELFDSKIRFLRFYYTLVYPYLNYGLRSWGTACKTQLNKIQIRQNKCLRSKTKLNSMLCITRNVEARERF